MESSNQFLGTERIGKLMRKYAIPCIISLLVGALYNIVDQIFIANASYLGSYGNAANTVVFPLTVVALAIAVMIGDGCCAVVGIVMKFFQIVISIVVGMAAGCIPIVGFNMGAGKSSRVKALFASLLISEAVVGAVALVLVEAFPRQLIALFGAVFGSSLGRWYELRVGRAFDRTGGRGGSHRDRCSESKTEHHRRSGREEDCGRDRCDFGGKKKPLNSEASQVSAWRPAPLQRTCDQPDEGCLSDVRRVNAVFGRKKKYVNMKEALGPYDSGASVWRKSE